MFYSFSLYFSLLAGVWLQLFVEWCLWATGHVSHLPIWPALVLAAAIHFFARFGEKAETTVAPASLVFWGFLPVCLLTVLKLPLPDGAADTVYYHLYLQSFDFHKLATSDFLPAGVGTYLFPLTDRAFGIFRELLGYRGGTLLNTIALWVSYVEIGGILGGRRWPLAALLVLSTEYVLLNVGIYHNDLIALPFLLFMLRVLLDARKEAPSKKRLLLFAVSAGLAVTCKLTQVIFAALLAGLLLLELRGKRRIFAAVTTFVCVLVGVLPFLEFTWAQTGNPFFFMFNRYFKSELFPLVPFKDERWGPEPGILSQLLYPVEMWRRKLRVSEMLYYSGRIALIVLVVPLILYRKPWREWRKDVLCIATIVGLAAWQLTSGYVRYGLFLELLVGLLIVRECTGSLLPVAAKGIVGALFVWQAITAWQIIYTKHDWNHRSLKGLNFTEWSAEARRIGHDYASELRDSRLSAASGFISFVGNGGVESLATQQAPLVHASFWWERVAPALSRRIEEHVGKLRGGSGLFTLFYPKEEPEIERRLSSFGLKETGERFPCFQNERDWPFTLICAQIAKEDKS